MHYNCRTASLAQVLIGPDGVIEPLCNFCKTFDCDNTIEKTTLSIMGIQKEWRVLFRGSEPYAVVGCEGFQK